MPRTTQQEAKLPLFHPVAQTQHPHSLLSPRPKLECLHDFLHPVAKSKPILNPNIREKTEHSRPPHQLCSIWTHGVLAAQASATNNSSGSQAPIVPSRGTESTSSQLIECPKMQAVHSGNHYSSDPVQVQSSLTLSTVLSNIITKLCSLLQQATFTKGVNLSKRTARHNTIFCNRHME